MSSLAETINTPQQHPGVSEEYIDLREYIITLYESRRLIAITTLITLLGALAYLWVATPVYKADAVVQVEEKNPEMGELEGLSTFLVGQAQTPAEVEILKTRAVLSGVVQQLNLDTVASPHYFPIIGAAIARKQQEQEAGSSSDNSFLSVLLGVFGRSYAWQGEHIRIGHLAVPDHMLQKSLKLVVTTPNTYELFDENGQFIMAGRVGQSAKVAEGSLSGTELHVTELTAKPGTHFDLQKFHQVIALEKLRESLRIAERGRQTGILVIELEGTDPNRIADTVNAVAASYLRQHVERRSQEASKMLEFLDSQLPYLKTRADTAEHALQEHRAKTGSIDLTLEAEQILNKSTDVEKQISELKLQEPEVQRKFTSNHPARKALEQQLKQLYAMRVSLEKELKALPGPELEALKLARDAKVANELYVMLLNEAQELRVAKAGTLGNVHILDWAIVPIEPVKPKKGLTTAMGLALGLLTGILLAFLRASLTKTVDDPDQVERQTGLTVYISVPHSDAQERIAKRRQKNAQLQLLCVKHKHDYALESLRSLRTSLQIAVAKSRNNIICISGPSPQVGKSFVCANLAQIFSEANKRTLLIDADMRKGYLHQYFSVDRTNGLSRVISKDIDLEFALHETGHDHLDFLSSGSVPYNPSELLLSTKFSELLAEVSRCYDTVIIDTPPVLAVTDAAIIASHAGTNLLVLRSGTHSMKEIERTLKRFMQNGIVANGFIFNDVSTRARIYSYGKYFKYGEHYQYDYR